MHENSTDGAMQQTASSADGLPISFVKKGAPKNSNAAPESPMTRNSVLAVFNMFSDNSPLPVLSEITREAETPSPVTVIE